MTDLVRVLLATGAASVTLFGLLWGVSLARRDASIVDPFWGVGFLVNAVLAACIAPGSLQRRALLAGLAVLWGGRLSLYLLRRNWGQEEDFRYRAMREHHGERFGWVSGLTVFGLQALLNWTIGLVLVLPMLSVAPARLGWLDATGAGIAIFGLLYESIADRQLARFKADPARRGQVLDRGLWRWSRHPNYFGEAVVWWGLWLVALATPWGPWTVASPLLMTFLLLRVSGVPLLEAGMAARRPGYREYVARTSAFIPWPPRR